MKFDDGDVRRLDRNRRELCALERIFLAAVHRVIAKDVRKHEHAGDASLESVELVVLVPFDSLQAISICKRERFVAKRNGILRRTTLLLALELDLKFRDELAGDDNVGRFGFGFQS